MFNKLLFVAFLGCALVLSQAASVEYEKKGEEIFGEVKAKMLEMNNEKKDKYEIKRFGTEEGKKKIAAELEVLKKKLDEDLKSIGVTAGPKYEEEKLKLDTIYNDEKKRLNSLLTHVLLSFYKAHFSVNNLNWPKGV